MSIMWKWECDHDAKGVIIIVHGAFEHHGRYRWLVEMWRSNGFNVLMGDLPGQGMTSRSNRGHIDSFDEYIEEVEGWVHEAAKWELPVFIMGHSMGGLVVIRLLQEKKLPILAAAILSSPCLGLIWHPSKFLETLSLGLNIFAPKLKVNPQLAVDFATNNIEVQNSDVNDSLYIRKVSVRWYRELVQAMKQAFENVNKTADIPFLVMQGGNDKIVDKLAVRSWIDRAALKEKHFKEWENCYHEIFSESKRELVFQYTKDFVETRLRSLGYYIE
ncbi:lysophospholipase [Bacillus oleivorans]|uniref:Lysophospholipase n=2 Tax=Bacillus oleivorans TaxID=1448271 RepID=A0A285CW65_9BACI|nr:lysophospholipase [Bacillus oleivorans]